MMLFLANLMGRFFICDGCWRKREKLQLMYEESAERIDAELDIVKMLRDLRNFKILLTNTMMDKSTKFEIAHSDKNLIKLDTSDEDDDGENQE